MYCTRIACLVLLSGFLVGAISSVPVQSAYAESGPVSSVKPPRKSPGKSSGGQSRSRSKSPSRSVSPPKRSVAPPRKNSNNSAQQRDSQRRTNQARQQQESQRKASEARQRQESQRRVTEARQRQDADRKAREDTQRREFSRQRSMDEARKRETFQKRNTNDTFRDNRNVKDNRDNSRNDFFNRNREVDKRTADLRRRFGIGNNKTFSSGSTINRSRSLQDEVDRARLLKRSRDFLNRNRVTQIDPPRANNSKANGSPDLRSYNRDNRSFSDFNKKSDSSRTSRDIKLSPPTRSLSDSFSKKPDISYDPTPFNNNSNKVRTGDVPRTGSFTDFAKAGKTAKTRSDSFTDYAMRNRDGGGNGDDIEDPQHRGRDRTKNTRKHRSWHRRLNHNQNVRARHRRFLERHDHDYHGFRYGFYFSTYNDYFYGGYNYGNYYYGGYPYYNYCGFPSSWWVSFNWYGGHYRGGHFGFRFGHFYGRHSYTYWPQRYSYGYRSRAWWYNDYCDWYYGSWYRPYVNVIYVQESYDDRNDDSYAYDRNEYVNDNDSSGWLPTEIEEAPTLDDAWQLLSEGYLDEARDAFVEVGELFPFEGDPQIGYSLATGLLGDREASVYAMRKALNDEPESLLDVPVSSSMDIILNKLLETHLTDSREGKTDADTLFMISAIRYLLNEEAVAYFTIDEAIDMGDQSDSTLNLKEMVRAAMYENLYE